MVRGSGWLIAAIAWTLSVPAWAAESGEHLFTRKGCIACHALKGHAGADGTLGPDLSKLFKAKPSRDAKELAAFIRDPRSERPESAMPTFGLSQQEAEALTSYLLTPRTPSRRP
ncbi:MAG TPA: c-type cytochrome [Pantanalinema sp.]